MVVHYILAYLYNSTLKKDSFHFCLVFLKSNSDSVAHFHISCLQRSSSFPLPSFTFHHRPVVNASAVTTAQVKVEQPSLDSIPIDRQ